MTLPEARLIVGNKPIWELIQIKKALSKLELLNTPEENKRLEAVNLILSGKYVSRKVR